MVESRPTNSHNLTDEQQQYFSEDALNYNPSWEDILIMNSKGDTQRLIFAEPQPLKEHEIKYISEFHIYLKDNNLTIP
jgi:hypothetical protein